MKINIYSFQYSLYNTGMQPYNPSASLHGTSTTTRSVFPSSSGITIYNGRHLPPPPWGFTDLNHSGEIHMNGAIPRGTNCNTF